MNDFSFPNNKFFAGIAMESRFPRALRRLSGQILTGAIVIFAGLGVYVLIQHDLTFTRSLPVLPLSAAQFGGIVLTLLGIRMGILLINRFIRSSTFDKNAETNSLNIAQRLNYFAAELWFYGVYKKGSATSLQFLAALPQSDVAANILLRMGITLDEFRDFLSQYQHETPALFDHSSEIFKSFPQDREINSGDILAYVFNQDQVFRDFIISKQGDEETLRGAALWIEEEITNEDKENRWWSQEKLGRIPGLAKTWSFGPVFTIMQFATRVSNDSALMRPIALIGRDTEVKLLEDALLSQANANVLIVGEPGAGKETIVLGLTQMILQGRVFPELESKRVFQISGPSIVATGKTKGETEALLISMLNEAARAGDIILVIDQFPEFVESLGKIGIIASQILTPYLSSNLIHIIALADINTFRKFVEPDISLMAHFAKIEVRQPDERRLLPILKEAAPLIETQARGTVLITYPALKKVAEAGIRYLVEGALPERAIILMQELVTYASGRHVVLIGPELVAEYVGKKIKMPLGAITKEEQEKLINLEDRLHERVVNQAEAIGAIANTIRRARAGIQESKRPIGSFLFLGPTGVGKTETAKALAAVYFGSEDSMVRFDMTEYQTEDAIERLIGSFEKNEPGILGSRMRSSPYATLLLDEFEKADKKVIDLFLQILDEGMFTDASGKQINMRNTIIIATSNAGAQMVWHLVEGNIDPSTKKSAIIAEIQQEGKFKPELLNRFDSIIIYTPLSPEHLKQVARMMLKKLADRLQEQQNITFAITDELIDETARLGYDPTFGARPMRRFIQDKIEKVVADRIIKGELTRGGSIMLNAKDIA